jgi:hypothetical protein
LDRPLFTPPILTEEVAHVATIVTSRLLSTIPGTVTVTDVAAVAAADAVIIAADVARSATVIVALGTELPVPIISIPFFEPWLVDKYSVIDLATNSARYDTVKVGD